MAATTSSMRALVDGADVIVCCGGGGVGKTTIAAVLGREAAQRGRRVVVVTIDPARRLADALGIAGGLTGLPQPIPLRTGDAAPGADPAAEGAGSGGASDVSDADEGGPERSAGSRDRSGSQRSGEFWAMMLDAPAMFERVVRANAPDADQADRIVANRFYRNIARALSGTQEYMASEALHELHGDDRFDLVVVDTPPSRNALDFLEAPGVLTRFIDHAVFKLMMAPTRTGLRAVGAVTQPVLRAIGRVVGSDVLTDAVAFFQAFAGMEAGFRERAERVGALLHDDATRFVLVTAPQHDAISESQWFGDQLIGQGFEVAATVVNRLQPVFGSGSAADAIAAVNDASERGDVDHAALWANLAELRTVAEAQRAALRPLVERVGAAQLLEVPLLAGDVHDTDALDALARHLFSGATQPDPARREP